MNSLTGNLEPRVERACLDYLETKGLPAFRIKKARNELVGQSQIYAFAIPELKTIFLSESMVASIQINLNENLEMSILDKFVLLHESGHLHPLGIEYERFINSLYKKMVISGATVGIVSFLGLLACKKINVFNASTLASVVLSILAAPLLCDLIITIVIKKKLKKYSFSHADREYQKFIKNYYEEKDADEFALALLCQEELKELRDYLLKIINEHQSNASEDDYHQSIQELLTSINGKLHKK